MSIQCMFYDGTSKQGPMSLPTNARPILATGQMVSSLYAVDWDRRRACGYYPVIRAVASPDHVLISTAWADRPVDGVFEESVISEITQAEWDAQQQAADDAADDAAHEAGAPAGLLEGWTKPEKCLLRIAFKLAKEHWPTMTLEQFEESVRDEWDAVR